MYLSVLRVLCFFLRLYYKDLNRSHAHTRATLAHTRIRTHTHMHAHTPHIRQLYIRTRTSKRKLTQPANTLIQTHFHARVHIYRQLMHSPTQPHIYMHTHTITYTKNTYIHM